MISVFPLVVSLLHCNIQTAIHKTWLARKKYNSNDIKIFKPCSYQQCNPSSNPLNY